MATVFGRIVIEACRANPGGMVLAMDMTRLKPMRDEGQASFGMVVAALHSLGIVRARVSTASHLTKLQLLRITAEHGGKDAVEFRAV